jgi:hypothetical protein
MVGFAVGAENAAKGVKTISVNVRASKEKENDKARKFYLFTDLKNP